MSPWVSFGISGWSLKDSTRAPGVDSTRRVNHLALELEPLGSGVFVCSSQLLRAHPPDFLLSDVTLVT